MKALGTLGSGNHFLELQVVGRIEDPLAAKAYGLREGQVTAMIHTGSRGLGHQVCSEHVAKIEKNINGMETIGSLQIGIIVYRIDNLQQHQYSVEKERPISMRCEQLEIMPLRTVLH
ncbi:MAG: hypothetical protein Ct9H90mP23_2770 [Methanobacteriota archaeon]|nr:MAG: hypothetical protein Ct9H90mP23_2770 [Euryarchaeota archaeon]